MNTFDPSEVKQYYAQRVPDLKANKKDWRSPCPVHGGNGDQNFSVNPETGMCQCWSQCGKGWDIIGLEMALSGKPFGAARDEVFRMVGRPAVPYEERDIMATYDYTDAEGKLLYQVVRKTSDSAGKKRFLQRQPDGNGGWIWKAPSKLVPYNLHKFADVSFVVVVEGEKDAISLSRLGFTATTNSGGATNFNPMLAPYFAGKDVAIVPDNDEKGREHALDVAKKLSGVARSIKIVVLPDVAAKGDVTDWINAGNDDKAFANLYHSSSNWTPEWTWTTEIPDESDKYVTTLQDYIYNVEGTLDNFWDFRHQVGIPTPFQGLTDSMNGGMRNGEVYVIGANQGAGKTSLALQFMTKAVRSGHLPLLMSMEMGHRDVFQRMCGQEARVNLLHYARQQRNDEHRMDEYRSLMDATNDLMQYKFLVHRKAGVTPDYLKSEVERLKHRHPIDFVVLDHLQLMASTGNQRSDYEKFTAISRTLKQIAVELNVPVLLVSQTSRANTGRTELEVSDLRGSGAIEEDAAAVFLLYEDATEAAAMKISGGYSEGPIKAWLKKGKDRYGESGKYIPLLYSKSCARFDLWTGA